LAGIGITPGLLLFVLPALPARLCLSYHPASQKERRPVRPWAGGSTSGFCRQHGTILPAGCHNTTGLPGLTGRPVVPQHRPSPSLHFCFAPCTGGGAKRAMRCGGRAGCGHPPARRQFFSFPGFLNFPNRLCVCAVCAQNSRWQGATTPVQRWGTPPK